MPKNAGQKKPAARAVGRPRNGGGHQNQFQFLNHAANPINVKIAPAPAPFVVAPVNVIGNAMMYDANDSTDSTQKSRSSHTRSKNFTEEESIELIELWIELWVQNEASTGAGAAITKGGSKTIWHEITKQMNEKGYDRTNKQFQTRFYRLNSDYKNKMGQDDTNTGPKSQKSPYFDLFESVYNPSKTDKKPTTAELEAAAHIHQQETQVLDAKKVDKPAEVTVTAVRDIGPPPVVPGLGPKHDKTPSVPVPVINMDGHSLDSSDSDSFECSEKFEKGLNTNKGPDLGLLDPLDASLAENANMKMELNSKLVIRTLETKGNGGSQDCDFLVNKHNLDLDIATAKDQAEADGIMMQDESKSKVNTFNIKPRPRSGPSASGPTLGCAIKRNFVNAAKPLMKEPLVQNTPPKRIKMDMAKQSTRSPAYGPPPRLIAGPNCASLPRLPPPTGFPQPLAAAASLFGAYPDCHFTPLPDPRLFLSPPLPPQNNNAELNRVKFSLIREVADLRYQRLDNYRQMTEFRRTYTEKLRDLASIISERQRLQLSKTYGNIWHN